MGQGTHDKTIDATVCTDPSCVNPVTSGHFALALHYTITNTFTVTGTNGYTITTLPVPAAGLAGNSSQSHIYAGVNTQSATGKYSIVVETLDPATGVSAFVPISADALGGPSSNYHLALSDDGQYVYFSSDAGVKRALTSTFTVRIPLMMNGRAGGL